MSEEQPDLAVWMLERIDEDERLADEAKSGMRMFAGLLTLMAPAVWDPSHVLAECEAKRRIVNEWLVAVHAPVGNFGETVDQTSNRLAMEWTVKVLALPHANRLGYREEWKP